MCCLIAIYLEFRNSLFPFFFQPYSYRLCSSISCINSFHFLSHSHLPLKHAVHLFITLHFLSCFHGNANPQSFPPPCFLRANFNSYFLISMWKKKIHGSFQVVSALWNSQTGTNVVLRFCLSLYLVSPSSPAPLFQTTHLPNIPSHPLRRLIDLKQGYQL